MERTSKEEVNIPSIKEIRLERRRLARQNRKRRIFFNTTITWDGPQPVIAVRGVRSS